MATFRLTADQLDFSIRSRTAELGDTLLGTRVSPCMPPICRISGGNERHWIGIYVLTSPSPRRSVSLCPAPLIAPEFTLVTSRSKTCVPCYRVRIPIYSGRVLNEPAPREGVARPFI